MQCLQTTRKSFQRTHAVQPGRASDFKDRTLRLVNKANATLNSMTGYDTVDILKEKVLEFEVHYSDSRRQLQQLKSLHEQLQSKQSRCQRDINNLLQRKHLWTPDDVSLFTELFRNEHELDHEEKKSKDLVLSAEKLVDEAHDTLMITIRERYREEQLWSDKIRGASMFGTFALMLLNVILFVIVHGWIEPRRRLAMEYRLGNMFESRVDTIHEEFLDVKNEMTNLFQSGMKRLASNFHRHQVVISENESSNSGDDQKLVAVHPNPFNASEHTESAPLPIHSLRLWESMRKSFLRHFSFAAFYLPDCRDQRADMPAAATTLAYIQAAGIGASLSVASMLLLSLFN